MSSITNIKNMQESSALNRFNKIVLDNVPVSIITIDRDGYITSANKYFKNFSSGEDYHKINIFADSFFIRENLVEEYKKLLTVGGYFRKDTCHEINSKGEDKYFRIIAVPFRNKEGKIDGIVSLASDNTEAIVFKNKLLDLNNRMEDEIKEKTQDLNDVNKELKRVLDLKSVFMADVSHEFRTSLTVMQCSLELLNKSPDIYKKDAELFQNITAEIKKVSTMLSDLTLLNKTNTQNLKLFKKFNLDNSIARICKELKVVADEKKIEIEHKKGKLPVKIIGNKVDIEKMLSNLIRNAITYNKNNGWIKVWTEKARNGMYLKISDSGIGISKKDFFNIFERFYRVDKSRSKKQNESGLGLAICKYVAEEHGGKILVSSKLGQGSTFTVYLPLVRKS